MRLVTLVGVVLLVLASAAPSRGETVEELLEKAGAALKDGRPDEALKYAEKAVAAAPKNAAAHLTRGAAHEQLREHAEAVADFGRAIEIDPKLAEAYNRRGSEQFKLGKVKESLADFDRFLELRPEERDGHWKRGISLYYAGRFEDGRKQFEGYEKVDTNDVENAVWHYLCNARAASAEKARKEVLKIGKDRRVPMMEVYALFAGRLKPEDVLTAARAGEPRGEELNRRLFYAHLYLGLYHETEGDRKKAYEHLRAAADEHRIGHYMWDVARVHRDMLKKELE
jgi:lipoprotein NlpI